MDQVEEIKKKVNIVNIVSEHAAIKKKGKNFVGLCPFHGEKTPSFMVNEELQIYKCFGCGEGGDVYKFLMEVEGLTFAESLEKLANRSGVKLIKKTGEADPKRELLEVHHLAAEYYHYLLTKHSAGEVAREYLAERGIKERLIETFRIGYALPVWDGLVKYLLDKKGYKADVLIAAGLATGRDRRLFDRFRGRVMFPLYDIAGRVVGFSGRVLPGAKEEAKYINSPETEIYHKSKMLFGLTLAREAIKKKDQVVLVEGETDMISSYAAGVSETVAAKGTAVTDEMFLILSRLTNNFILALDTDDAGEVAMKRSIETAENLGLSIKMVEIVGGKDPDEIARKKPREWAEMVEKAVPVYEFFFDRAVAKWGINSVEAIGKVVKEVVPYLAKIDNSVIREVWAKKLSEKVGVEKARVWEEIEKVRSGRMTTEEKQGAIKKEEKREGDAEVVNLLLLSGPEFILKVKKMLSGLPLTGAAGKLIGWLLDAEIKNSEQFVRSLPEELREIAEAGYMMEIPELDEKVKLKMVAEWARRLIREERVGLSELIRKEEEGGDGAQLGVLSEKLVKLNALERRLTVE